MEDIIDILNDFIVHLFELIFKIVQQSNLCREVNSERELIFKLHLILYLVLFVALSDHLTLLGCSERREILNVVVA